MWWDVLVSQRMKCVIIAGGKGTRLGLSNIPKPMAPVRGVPIIEHQVRLAARYGFNEVVILAGYLASVIVDHLGDGSRYGVRIEYRIESEPLGTGGALLQVEDSIEDDFLVLYGDVFVDMNLRALVEFHRQVPAAGTLVVHPNSHPADSDLVETGDGWTVRAFHPKPHNEGTYRNLVNAALYVLGPQIFRYIPRNGACDLGKHVFPAVLAAGETLRAYSTPEYLKDMGTPERLSEVEQDLSADKPARRNLESRQKCIFLDRDGIINTESGGVLSPAEFELTPGIVQALRKINASDYLAVVVTNQPFIAKGLMTEETLYAVHAKMDTLLGIEGAFVDALYYCPHHPEKGWPGEVPELKIDCDCRKPKPGMILSAAERFNIDLASSFIVGDNIRDTQAGIRAGLRASLFIGSVADAEAQASHQGVAGDTVTARYTHRFDSVPEAVNSILKGAV